MAILKDLSNSAASVDFDKEISGIISGTVSVNNRELKLVVAIVNDPAHFNVKELLGSDKAKKDSRSKRQEKALIAYSKGFASQYNAAVSLKQTISGKGATPHAKDVARTKLEPIQKSLAAAVKMFDSALFSAYYVTLSKAVIGGKSFDKSLTLTYRTPWTRLEGMEGETVVTALDTSGKCGAVTETLSRDTLHQFGKQEAYKRGLIDKPTSSKSKDNGAAALLKAAGTIDPKTETTVTSLAKTFASTVAGLNAADKSNVSNHPDFEELIVETTRARFAHDGSIDAMDVIELLRKAGLNVNTDRVGKTSRTRKAA